MASMLVLPKILRGEADRASRTIQGAVLPPTSASPDRSPDHSGREELGPALRGPDRQDQDAGQRGARTPPLGAAVPEPAVPALRRVPACHSRPPLIPAQAFPAVGKASA